MKKLLALLVTSAFLVQPVLAKEETKQPETKKVCITTKDAKTGKDVEKCRMMKKHEKHEGTKVPEKPPAKAPAKKDENKK